MAESIALTTEDNELTVNVNGTEIKQIYVKNADGSTTKVYQKWAETNCAFYARARMSTVRLSKFTARYDVQAQIIRSKKGSAESLSGEAVCAVVYCNGTSWTTSWVEDGDEGTALDVTFTRGKYSSSDGDYNNMGLKFYVTLVVNRGGKTVSYKSSTGTSASTGQTTSWLATQAAYARLEKN